VDATRHWTRLADRRVVDAAVVLACLSLTVLAVKTPWADLPRPVIAAAAVAGSAAQWWRRRWPQLAAVAGAASYALSGNPGPWLAGLYAGASYAPRRHVWALVIAGWAGFATWSWIDAGHLTSDDVIWAALATVAVAVLGVYAATRRALVASLRERAEDAEAQRRLRDEQARAAERTRIAREMHDVLAHKVSLIALHAGALELTASGSSAKIQHGAELIRVTARETLQELRYVLGVLRTEPLSDDQAFADLPTLVRSAADAGQRVELADRAGPRSAAIARVVYRVAQEGLTNARKHAPDAPVTVAVDREGDTVTVTVRNASPAGPPADLPGSGSGLVGLAERVRLVGGTLHSGPLDGGWELRADLPWLGEAS
jgi:signal transduction histidine kinase